MSLWDKIIPPKDREPVAPSRPRTGSMWDPVKAKIPPTPGPTRPNFTFPATPNASTGYKHGSNTPSNNQGSAADSPLIQAASAVNPALALPDPRTQIDPAYDAASKRIGELNTGLSGEFDKAIQSIRDRYLQSDGDMYNQYQNNRAALDASATGLGVDPNAIYKDYDQNLRRVEENSNMQQNSSLDFFEKLKSLRGQQFVDMQASLEQQRAKALADQTAQWVQLMAEMDANSKAGSSGGGSGGGGGRGRGGGSSSSGSVKEKATETQTLYDPEFLADYQELLKINPAAANAMMETYLATESSPSVKAMTGSIATTSQDLKDNKFSSFDPFNTRQRELEANPFVAAPGAATKERDRKNRNRTNAQKLREQQIARNFLIRRSGSLGNPQTKQTVTRTGT